MMATETKHNPVPGQRSEPVNRQSLDTPEGSQALQEFVYSVFELNHDLNNPLAGVIGYIELVLTQPEGIPQQTIRLLESAMKSAEIMDNMIKKLTASKRELQTKFDTDSLDPERR